MEILGLRSFSVRRNIYIHFAELNEDKVEGFVSSCDGDPPGVRFTAISEWRGFL